MKNLEALGKAVAEENDAAVAEAKLVEQTQARLAWPEEVESSSRRPWVLALAAVVVCGVVAAVVLRTPRSISLETSGVAVNTWVSAQEEQPLAFSDGATVLATKGSRFKVAQLDASGAKVTLERGALSVSVPHRDQTKWTFDVGPFVVHVVGTRFDTGWDPNDESFTLVMHDGAVRVEGPDVRTQAVAGQRLSFSLKSKPVEVVEPPSPPVEEAAVVVEPEPRVPSKTPVPAWKVLAQKRQYAEALEAAKAVGWSKLCLSTSMSDVVLLGDVARLSGDAASAHEAYRQARTRFPKSRAADTATFFLGRLAFDARDDATAEKWFVGYRAEFPSGPFAAEALGRRLELAKRSGDAAKMRELAAQYVAQYPSGPHSRLAKSVLERE